MTELRRAQLVKITHGIIWATIAVVVATPLFFSGKFYFPFIYPKSLVFELAAEVMGLVFFGLLLLDRQRHIRLNPAVVLYAAVIIVELLAGIFGINFVRSFWSTFERAEGIFLHLHLLAFLFVITNFIRDRRAWLILFDISVLVSVLVSLVSLLQYFGLDWLKDVGDTRLAATVGNAAFFAGYLLFHIFIALFLYTQRREQGRRWAYATAVLLEVFILFQTGTRGAIIALAIGGAVLLVVTILQSSGQVKKIAIGGLVVLILGGAGLFALKNTPVVQNFLALRRITSLSLADRTVQTRLMTWGSATQGFLNRPILGYGPENFNYVFNLHFNPGIYEDPGSAIWFDRAHSVVFDRLTTTGVVGLIVYIGFIGYPFVVLLRRKKEDDVNQEVSKVVLYMGLAVGTYVLQNFFVFDSLVTLFPLMMVMGFVSFIGQREWGLRWWEVNGVRYSLISMVVVAVALALVFGVIRPTKANMLVLGATDLRESGQIDDALDYYRKALSYNAYGNFEVRRLLFTFASEEMDNRVNLPLWQQQLDWISEQINQQIAKQPSELVSYLLAMRFNNSARSIRPTLLADNFDLFEKARQLSPTRAHLFYEIGYTQLYLMNRNREQGNAEIATLYGADALKNFSHVLELNPKVIEAHTTYVMALINVGQIDAAIQYLDTMDRLNIDWRSPQYLTLLANTSVILKEYQITKRFYEELVAINDENPQHLIGLAISNAYLGNNEEAIRLARQVILLDPTYADSANQFVDDVVAGKYSTQ